MKRKYVRLFRKKYPEIITNIVIIACSLIMTYDIHTSENKLITMNQHLNKIFYIGIGFFVVMSIFTILMIWYKKLCNEDCKDPNK